MFDFLFSEFSTPYLLLVWVAIGFTYTCIGVEFGAWFCCLFREPDESGVTADVVRSCVVLGSVAFWPVPAAFLLLCLACFLPVLIVAALLGRD